MQNRITRLELGNWDDIRLFLGVARTSSFNKAAEVLRINQATVSRRIGQLERRLGTKLFDRHGKGVRMTPAARSVMERAEGMEASAQAIERQLVGVDCELQGNVRIAATEGIAAAWLTPRLLTFMRAHPRIVVEVLSGTELADLARREADIAIRLSRPMEPGLVGIQVGSMKFSLYCSRPYADIYGIPKTMDELYSHRIVDHGPYSRLTFWQDIIKHCDTISYRTNTSSCYLEAVKSGYGIGVFPTYTPKYIASYLIEISIPLDNAFDIWLLSHEETRNSAKIKALLGFIRDQFARDRESWFS